MLTTNQRLKLIRTKNWTELAKERVLAIEEERQREEQWISQLETVTSRSVLNLVRDRIHSSEYGELHHIVDIAQDFGIKPRMARAVVFEDVDILQMGDYLFVPQRAGTTTRVPRKPVDPDRAYLFYDHLEGRRCHPDEAYKVPHIENAADLVSIVRQTNIEEQNELRRKYGSKEAVDTRCRQTFTNELQEFLFFELMKKIDRYGRSGLQIQRSESSIKKYRMYEIGSEFVTTRQGSVSCGNGRVVEFKKDNFDMAFMQALDVPKFTLNGKIVGVYDPYIARHIARTGHYGRNGIPSLRI